MRTQHHWGGGSNIKYIYRESMMLWGELGLGGLGVGNPMAPFLCMRHWYVCMCMLLVVPFARTRM